VAALRGLPAGVRHQSKQSLKAMNRLLFGGCLVVFFGCGARTESFFDPDGSSGAFGVGGSSASAGRNFGGASNVAGWVNQVAGSSSVGGTINVAGSVGVAGSTIAGSFGTGGHTGVAGAPGKGGASFGGFTGVAGGIGRGGAAGRGGGSSVIEETCKALTTSSCQQCLCSTCSSQIVQCISNLGCALILACAQQTGCQGVACYSPMACKPVIDQYGGLTGPAAKDVLALLACATTSQANCNCN